MREGLGYAILWLIVEVFLALPKGFTFIKLSSRFDPNIGSTSHEPPFGIVVPPLCGVNVQPITLLSSAKKKCSDKTCQFQLL